MEQGYAPHEVAPGGAGEDNQVEAAATRRPGERSNRPEWPPNPDREPAGEQKSHQEAAGGVFRSWVDSQPPRIRDCGGRGRVLESEYGLRRQRHIPEPLRAELLRLASTRGRASAAACLRAARSCQRHRERGLAAHRDS